jgi:hypothetical protein
LRSRVHDRNRRVEFVIRPQPVALQVRR